MSTLGTVSFALGLALASTGAWAEGATPDITWEEDPPIPQEWTAVILAPCDARMATPCTLYPGGNSVTYMNNGEKPLTIDLSSDQKLARAYALCANSAFDDLMQRSISDALHNAPMPLEPSEDCRIVMVAYERNHEHQSEADRAFIEEVARGLK